MRSSAAQVQQDWHTTPLPAPPRGGGSQSAISRAAFTACVDGCVTQLVAQPVAAANDPAQLQLRAWLLDSAQALDDGTPIDLALFDAAILSIGERVPAAGAAAQTQLLHAARLLAESIYSTKRN